MYRFLIGQQSRRTDIMSFDYSPPKYAQVVAEQFGGGGHNCASGLSLDGPLSVSVERVLAQFRIMGETNAGVRKRSQWPR